MIIPAFPAYPFQIKNLPEGAQVFCEIRKRWVKLTPEEWVRQNVFQWMKQTLQYPREMISLEKGIMVGEMAKRYDLLVYDQQFNPWMLVECKAQSVMLTEETLMQVLRYHIAIPVPYLCITNGDGVMVFEKIDGRLCPLEKMPSWMKGER
ncbi:MAG: type I restriction enzyme HsdR N-terminal domain-containing protein [Sphingobacteriales bacterium]|nr:MAG: type I restriction enzyme HsdR N-terminal domain-containing protein [Sphingobacteriales bacterium]